MSAISFGTGRKQICGVVNHMRLFLFLFFFQYELNFAETKVLHHFFFPNLTWEAGSMDLILFAIQANLSTILKASVSD
jgi:hypothetical protein